ncbi:MAG: ATP-binding protein [Magnetococcales bacterium]|nr:ATP-binding protein [Magnetococcales bacterium]
MSTTNNSWTDEIMDNPPVYDPLSDIQSNTRHPLLVKLLGLQNHFGDKFNQIKDDFVDIFPFVEAFRVVGAKEYFPDLIKTPFDIWVLAIKEKDVQNWIPAVELSTGMLRTLKILLELFLAPKGSVFLVDEFENSLGVNCLPQVAEAARARQNDIQFIITSHHPYVINNIPWTSWKVVTRHGGTVTVRDVEHIPELQTDSSMDHFLLLLNSETYEDGIR